MKKPRGTKPFPHLLLTICFILLAPGWAAPQGADVPRTLVTFSEQVLLPFGRNPMIVAAVKAQNGRKLSIGQIREIDRQWMETEGVSRFMLNLMSNDCALALYNLQSRYPFIVESFVTDNQGANVGQTIKTSDYWQGDEAKFTRSFLDGKGGLYFGSVEYDESSGEIVVQISIPVMEGSQAIGTITFSVSLDRWERR